MTFIGSIPNPLRSIVSEAVKSWPKEDVYVACSGNFTIERTLLSVDPTIRIHSEDVSIYTTAVGRWLTDAPVELTLTEEYREIVPWLEPYLDGATSTVAALMLATRFAADLGSDHPWRRRNVEGHVRQFEAMHAKTVAKLDESRFRLASYDCQDVRDWLDTTVPEDATVLSFPPFDTGGYEKLYERLDAMFDWPRPTYEILDEDGVEAVVQKIADRPRYLMGVLQEREDLAEHLVSYVKPTPGGRPFYVYAKSDTKVRYVVPNVKPAPVTIPRLTRGEEIGDTMTLHRLTDAEFHAVRSKYLNPAIKTTMGNLKVPTAVLVDGKMVGVFCFGLWQPGSADRILLTTDFAVAPHDYPKLSKLVVMAALSTEAQLTVEQMFTRRCREIQTAVYSNSPVSMKYRGLMDLAAREEREGEPFKFKLSYEAEAGRWSLADALDEWKRRWGQRRLPDPAPTPDPTLTGAP